MTQRDITKKFLWGDLPLFIEVVGVEGMRKVDAFGIFASVFGYKKPPGLRKRRGLSHSGTSDWKRYRQSITIPPRNVSCEVIILSAPV